MFCCSPSPSSGGCETLFYSTLLIECVSWLKNFFSASEYFKATQIFECSSGYAFFSPVRVLKGTGMKKYYAIFFLLMSCGCVLRNKCSFGS